MRTLFFLLLMVLSLCGFAQPRSFIADFRADTQFEADGEQGKLQLMYEKPGFSFLSAAILPGSSQLAQGKFVKALTFLAIEATALYIYIDRQNNARRVEDLYHQFGDENFSVVLYADWLVRFNQYHGRNVDLQDLATEGSVIDPNSISGNARNDWRLVDINALRELERNTLFGGNSGNPFSHFMPDYGSQQYYELMSKYFQYGPGWKDFTVAPSNITWGPASMSDGWFYHGSLGETFNDDYRLARNMLNLLIMNHVISSIDAFIVSKQRKISLEADLVGQQAAPGLTLGMRF